MEVAQDHVEWCVLVVLKLWVLLLVSLGLKIFESSPYITKTTQDVHSFTNTHTKNCEDKNLLVIKHL
jgi:hypothetical protein